MGRRALAELVLPAGTPRRVRKLAALTLILLFATAISLLVEFRVRNWVSFGGTAVVFLTTVGCLLALRRGASLVPVTTVLLAVGVADAGLMAMLAGVDGVTSLSWLILGAAHRAQRRRSPCRVDHLADDRRGGGGHALRHSRRMALDHAHGAHAHLAWRQPAGRLRGRVLPDPRLRGRDRAFHRQARIAERHARGHPPRATSWPP